VSLSKRIVFPLTVAIVVALPLLLSACGNPVAAPPAPTVTPVPATATAAPPTGTPGPSSTPTLPPTPTPVPVDATTRPVPFPDVSQYATSIVAVDARAGGGYVAALTDGTVRAVDASSGRVVGPITVTAGSSDKVSFGVDAAHGRAVVVLDSEYSVTPTMAAVDLATGRLRVDRVLRGVPQATVSDAVVAPGGDVFAAIDSAGAFNPTTSQLVRLSADGAVRRTRAISDQATLTLDPRAGVVIAQAPSGSDAPTLAAYDARTLAPLWQGVAPYDPQAVAVDPARGRLWLLAAGGRATILDERTGHTIAVCDPTYTKPTPWEGDKDLVVDPRTGIGYASEIAPGQGAGATAVWIDRIDPTTKARTTLTEAGGAVGAVLTRSGRLLTLDGQGNLVLRDPANGTVVAVVATNATLAGSSGSSFSSSGSDLSGVSIAQAGAVVTVARGATVPYQNNVTGSSTTGGVVIVTFRDHP